MVETVKERLQALREGRQARAEPLPVTGIESARLRATMPGFDGRADRVRKIRSRVAGISPFEAAGSPFENLVFTRQLALAADVPGISLMRAEAGYLFRQDVEMAQISTLGAKDFGSVGGGGGRATLADVKIYAMQSVGQLRASISKRSFWVLESLIINDAWLLEMPVPKAGSPKMRAEAARIAGQRREAMLLEIWEALDAAAVHYDLLRYPEFKGRWPNATFSRREKATA